MATRFLLIRHASHDLLGNTLAGRTRDVGINARGEGEADALVARLSGAVISALYVSPRLRARATAAPLAKHCGLLQQEMTELDEIDFGDWSGRRFTELHGDPAWSVWCERRQSGKAPNGEAMIEVQARVVTGIERLRAGAGEATVALVSHGDVIKAALAHYLGLSLDHLERFDIAPASVSVVHAGEGWAQVRLVNDTGRLLP